MDSSEFNDDPLDCFGGFSDFNLSALLDSTFRTQVSRDELYRIVYRARRGDRGALAQLEDIFRSTLSKTAAEMFAKEHVRRPVHPDQWIHEKFFWLMRILLYEELQAHRRGFEGTYTIKNPLDGYYNFQGWGASLDPGAIEKTLRWEQVEQINWHDWLRSVCLAPNPKERVSTLDALLMAYRRAQTLAALPKSYWGKNAKRDEVILSGLERGIEREQICAELDRLKIPVNLPALENFQTWFEAWADPDGKDAVQQLFSKLKAKLGTVKTFILSE